MAIRPTTRIMPGTPYPARAEQWNDVVDMVNVVSGEHEPIDRDQPAFQYLQNATHVRSASAAHDVGEYVILEGNLTDPSTALEPIFRANPIPTCVESDWDSNHWGKIAILAQPSYSSEIVRAYVTGTAIAKIIKKYAYHDHADINPNNSYDDNGVSRTPLVSHPSGSWQILWTEATPAPNPDDSEPGWAILRHRGIWDRTLFGTADSSISPPTNGDTSGTVSVYFNGADTGEDVTAFYPWKEGAAISAGDKVEIEWQSDEQRWTIKKVAAGGGVPSPGSQYYINETTSTGQGKFTLFSRPDDYEASGGEIQLSTGDITVDRNGLYWVSYNLWVTPGSEDISYDDQEWDANGFIHKYITINCRSMNTTPAAVKVNINQRLELVYYRDEQVDPSQPSKLWKSREVCISGSGFFQLDAAWTCEVRWDSEVNGHQIAGDVHVHRVREGY